MVVVDTLGTARLHGLVTVWPPNVAIEVRRCPTCGATTARKREVDRLCQKGGRPASRSPRGQRRGLAQGAQEPREALVLEDQRDEAHATLAPIAVHNVHFEGTHQELSPGPISRARGRRLLLFLHSVTAPLREDEISEIVAIDPKSCMVTTRAVKTQAAEAPRPCDSQFFAEPRVNPAG